MDSLAEKVTLYDLLGYLFPGCIMDLMILAGLYHKYTDWFSKFSVKECPVGFYLAFFGISYLAGLTLSELSTWIVSFYNAYAAERIKKIKKAVMKWGRNGRAPEADGAVKEIGQTGISVERLAEALEKSGVEGGRDEIKRKIEIDGWKIYKARMYGAIQYKGEYKRIHNYASMKVLCKNLVLALVVGQVVLRLCGVFSWIFLAVVVPVAVLLMARGIRFGRKKNMYTVIWFTDMFLNSKNEEQGD